MQLALLLLLVLLGAASGRPLEAGAEVLVAEASTAPDDLIHLQGSIPRDTDGREVSARRRPAGGGGKPAPRRLARRWRRRPASHLPATWSSARFLVQVHAHGGQLLHIAGVYYWVGTSRKEQRALVSSDINLYFSEQLSGPWTFLGSIFNWRQIQGYPDRWP